MVCRRLWVVVGQSNPAEAIESYLKGTDGSNMVMLESRESKNNLRDQEDAVKPC
jgi:hypothetical protein